MTARLKVGQYSWDKKILNRLIEYKPDEVPQTVFTNPGRSRFSKKYDNIEFASKGFSESKKRLVEAGWIELVLTPNREKDVEKSTNRSVIHFKLGTME